MAERGGHEELVSPIEIQPEASGDMISKEAQGVMKKNEAGTQERNTGEEGTRNH